MKTTMRPIRVVVLFAVMLPALAFLGILLPDSCATADVCSFQRNVLQRRRFCPSPPPLGSIQQERTNYRVLMQAEKPVKSVENVDGRPRGENDTARIQAVILSHTLPFILLWSILLVVLSDPALADSGSSRQATGVDIQTRIGTFHIEMNTLVGKLDRVQTTAFWMPILTAVISAAIQTRWAGSDGVERTAKAIERDEKVSRTFGVDLNFYIGSDESLLSLLTVWIVWFGLWGLVLLS